MNIRFILLLLLFIRLQPAASQDYLLENVRGGTAFANDINGMPFYLKMEYQSEGSIFFNDEYREADITTLQGILYKGVKVKYNLLDNQLLYQTPDGKEMVALSPVARIAFSQLQLIGDSMQPVVLTGGADIINKTGATVYQLIDTGKACLFRKLVLTWREDTQYGQAGSVRKFERQENEYWVKLNNEYTKLEKNRAFFTKLFSDKATDIGAYIDRTSPKYKSLTDLRKIIQFYNSL